MRYAMKFAYLGRNFRGYQRQPGIRTVEGEIINVLSSQGIIKDTETSNFQSASRTDSGVSAIGNVVALDTDLDQKNILPALNSQFRDIWFYGIAPVNKDFNPRHAQGRIYRYFLPDREEIDPELLQDAALLFLGEHDFKNFCKKDEEKGTVRTIESVVVRPRKGFFTLEFRASSFLWNMVRRMVSAVEAAALGRSTLDEVKEVLGLKSQKGFGIAPPQNLVLVDVVYKDVGFDKDERAVALALERLEEVMLDLNVQKKVLDEIQAELEFDPSAFGRRVLG